MLYGADYYPELWPRAQWLRDIELMVAADLNVVRVGDLCWSAMEQEPGRALRVVVPGEHELGRHTGTDSVAPL